MTLFNSFSANPLSLVLVCIVFGLIIGSFLNVVIYRLPIMMQQDWKQQCCELLDLDHAAEQNQEPTRFNLSFPNSHCPNCDHTLSAWQNIPVFSYLFLRGKCAHCNRPISVRYPIIEITTAILSGLVAWHFGATTLTLLALLFTWCLIALTMIDFDHQLLPDDITLPLLWGGLILNSFGVITDLSSALWGAVAGYLTLWSIYWLFKLVTGKEGMGFGDFKLLAALGAWMGWQALPVIVILSSFVGAAIGITLVVIKGRDKNIPIPFGPYLACAGFIALLWGDQLTQFYLQSFAL